MPHIIVFEDDATVLEFYGDLLSREGYHVTLVRGCRVSPADVSALQPDLVIVNLAHRDPESDADVLARLRADTAPGHPPVMVCSGDVRLIRKLDEQLRAWCCAVVPKPFDLDDLLGAVRSCLARGAATSGLAFHDAA